MVLELKKQTLSKFLIKVLQEKMGELEVNQLEWGYILQKICVKN